MDVTLLYFDGCPNWQETDERLRLALRTLGEDEQQLEWREVNSPEEAERLSFRGSPTVLVDGEDPFADPSAPVGLSCRLFRTPAGLAGAPTIDQPLQALRRAA
ncbi:MAG: thioredoxin family protein [Actinomycetota bacterium]|nr:thioredoxin family protein [Actinomycetota bacterium]